MALFNYSTYCCIEQHTNQKYIEENYYSSNQSSNNSTAMVGSQLVLQPKQVSQSPISVLLFNMYDFVMNDDVKNKFVVKNPYAAPAIILCYVLFVKWIGPALMKNRKPFNLKYTMMIYNFTQSFVNAIIAHHLLLFGIDHWQYHCLVKYHPSLNIFLQRVLKHVWWLNLTKYGDLLDTVFFVLRKKNSHISFLHVFHHSTMCLLFSRVLKSFSVGYYLLIVLAINTSIHVVMYFYYGLAAMGPHMQKYLWWKKYLTTIQIVQFVSILTYMVIQFIRGCEELALEECSVAVFAALLLILFLNFYFKSYNKKSR